MRPAVNHHDGVKGHADHRASLDQRPDLIVSELAIPVRQSAAIVVARPNRSGVVSQRIPEAFIAKMRGIENDAQPFHLFQQLAAFRRERPLIVSPVPVDSRAVVDRPDRDQSIGARFFEMPPGEDRVAPFEAQQIADGQLWLCPPVLRCARA